MAVDDGSLTWVERMRQSNPGLASYQGLAGRVVGEPWDKSVPFDPEFAKAPAGTCIVGRHAAAHVWLVANDGNTYCRDHLRNVIRIAIWPLTFRPE